MKTTEKSLTPELVMEIRSKGIDFSDIPELTEESIKEFYPKNWKLQVAFDYVKENM